MTNAERIRSMTDEELAKEFGGHGWCPHVCKTMYREDETDSCYKCWIGWLKQDIVEIKNQTQMVVHCRECQYYESKQCYHPRHDKHAQSIWQKEDDFCSYGVKA